MTTVANHSPVSPFNDLNSPFRQFSAPVTSPPLSPDGHPLREFGTFLTAPTTFKLDDELEAYMCKTLIAHAIAALTAKRLVFVASDTPHKAELLGVLQPQCIAVEYDAATATATDLIALVHAAVAKNGGHHFASVALANSPAGAGFEWRVGAGYEWRVSDAVVVADATSIGDEVISFVRALGAASVRGGRVDFFSNPLLASDVSGPTFERIASLTESHFAASDDLAGSAVLDASRGWIMTSDGTDVKPLYFVDDTSPFTSKFTRREKNATVEGLGARRGSRAGLATSRSNSVAKAG